MNIFKRQKKKKKRKDQQKFVNQGDKNRSSIDEEGKDTQEKSLQLDTRESIQDLTLSPYLNQLHLYFEKSLLEENGELDEAHHLSEFLMENPEFYPLDGSEKKSKKKRKEMKE